MSSFRLPKNVHVETVAMKIEKNEAMVNFYKNILGFILKIEENNLSIFGSQGVNSRLLILEQKFPEYEQEKEVVKKANFSLSIPTEEEFGGILKRIRSQKYPIKDFQVIGNRQIVFLEDPEGNLVELNCKITFDKNERTMGLDIPQIIDKVKTKHIGLSMEVHFDQIKLTVKNKKKSVDFYQTILGMDQEDGCLSMDDKKILVHLEEQSSEVDKENRDKQLGLDFFVLMLAHKNEMAELKEHLEAKKVDFFVDQKLKILTIFDPDDIEWWFVRD